MPLLETMGAVLFSTPGIRGYNAMHLYLVKMMGRDNPLTPVLPTIDMIRMSVDLSHVRPVIAVTADPMLRVLGNIQALAFRPQYTTQGDRVILGYLVGIGVELGVVGDVVVALQTVRCALDSHLTHQVFRGLLPKGTGTGSAIFSR